MPAGICKEDEESLLTRRLGATSAGGGEGDGLFISKSAIGLGNATDADDDDLADEFGGSLVPVEEEGEDNEDDDDEQEEEVDLELWHLSPFLSN